MALIKCKECGHEISKQAKICPSCGAKNHTTPKLVKVCFVLLCSFFIWSIFSTPSISPSYEATLVNVNPVEIAPLLEVLSWNCSKEHGYAVVTGEVKNISGISLRNVMAVATHRTKDGTFVKVSDAYLEYNPILSKQTSPFKVITTDNPAIKSCTVSFKTSGGKELSYIGSSEK